MLTSIALVLLCGFSASVLVKKCHLPPLCGMLMVGILLGPYAFGLLDDSLLSVSAAIRQMALTIILLRAGLSLDLSALRRVGRSAVLLSFLPATLEIIGYVLVAPPLLGISRIEAAVMGTVLGAVSPAVIVPRMLKCMEEGRGTEHGIPQMITAGASCDDVFVIVLFTSFVQIADGGTVKPQVFLRIPVSIGVGIACGLLCGLLLTILLRYASRHGMDAFRVTILLLAFSLLLVGMETNIDAYVPFSGLLAVMACACVYAAKSDGKLVKTVSGQYGKLWSVAEIFLFVLVGAAVDVRYTFATGLSALFVIVLTLLFRAAGVWLCTLGTPLTARERLFCVLAYLPKATVQAAIGSVPLSMGLPCGQIVLSVAVCAILVTAPLGALAIDTTYKKLLS